MKSLSFSGILSLMPKNIILDTMSVLIERLFFRNKCFRCGNIFSIDTLDTGRDNTMLAKILRDGGY